MDKRLFVGQFQMYVACSNSVSQTANTGCSCAFRFFCSAHIMDEILGKALLVMVAE